MRFSAPLLLLLIAVAGCGGQFTVKDRDRVGMSDSQPTGRAALDARKRDRVPRLTEEFLYSDEPLSLPVQMVEFAAPDDATLVTGVTTGALQLVGAKADRFDVHDDRFGYASESGGQLAAFPDVSFAWVQQDGFVIPTDQGVLRLTNPYWEIAFQTGRAWVPASDPDAVRYSVPFALLERNANCTHNGVLSWVVSATGTPSRAAYQIASETCAYFKFDMQGTLRTKNKPGPDLEPKGLIGDVEKNRQARLPVQSFASLAERYPAVDPSQFGAVANMSPADTTVYGFVAEGRHYRSGCMTRRGPYPFCDELLLPSYSTAKSIFAGLALMRLEAVLPGAAEVKISTLLPECDSAGWGEVTLENTLDMATGRYLSSKLEADEALDAHVSFIYAEKHVDKIKFACGYFPKKAEPGLVMAYHSSDTYVAGTAMRTLLQQNDRNANDIYSALVVEPIWEPLELSQAIRSTRKTYDAFAQPLAGWGLSYQSDDIARIGRWLVNGAALPDDIGLDERLYRAAMQQDTWDRGLTAGSDTVRYNNGFWALDVASFIGCEKRVWVPFMSGFGGVSVVLFPNQTIYYMFADGYVHRWREAAIESNKIRDMCQ